MLERQVIATWYTPGEKMPPEGCTVVISMSGKCGAVYFDHALACGSWMDDGLGWEIEGLFTTSEEADLTIHAWCDLDPYGYKEREING